MNKTVTIPKPQVAQGVYRGFTGKQTADTFPVSIRWTVDDKQYIERQAHLSGLTFSEFVRWCAARTAQELARTRVVEEFDLKEPRLKPRIDMSEYE